MEKDLIYRVKNGLVNVEKGVIVDSDFTKPWGGYATLARNEICTPKDLELTGELSLQAHRNRDEKWYLTKGLIAVYLGLVIEPADDYASKIDTLAGLKEKILQPGDGIYIPRGMAHSARNLDDSSSAIFEVSLGNADENDITRFYDKSGRIKLDGVPNGLTAPEVIEFCKKNAEKLKESYRNPAGNIRP